MHPSTLAIGATVPVFLALTWHHFAPSSTAYAAIGLTTGIALVVFAMRQLWRAIRLDVVTAMVVVTTVLASIVLPVLQWAVVLPSVFISSAVFGGLVVGVFRHRIPDWADLRRDH